MRTLLLLLVFSAPGLFADELPWRKRQQAEFADLPRPATLPRADANGIDDFVAGYWRDKSHTPLPAVADEVFLRRVHLDVRGLAPAPEQLEAFRRDTAADKRAKVVETLLADAVASAEHGMTFWNDILRNDEQTNIDGLRKPVTTWLYPALLANRPVDEMVGQLLDPVPGGPDGYLKGVNWRGQVNASQTPPIQAAQNVAQAFLSSSIKCASCHNSFTNSWKLEQAYGLASFFSAVNLQMHRCDAPTGRTVPPRFPFPDLGTVPANADARTRLKAVSRMVTSPKNPLFAKTIVNRVWKQLLGRGLFEPADDYENATVVHPALLDWLAWDFMAHDYDLKYLRRLILTSGVYAQPADLGKTPAKGVPTLKGPTLRRLSAEQYVDGLSRATGYWPKPATMAVDVANADVRAWRYKKPDALLSALGRPNREQIATERDPEASVVQSLELVNGTVLADRLRAGASALLDSPTGRAESADAAAQTLYRAMLGRDAAPAELAVARGLVGTPATPRAARQAGWEDLLWVLCVHPDYAFIR